jgi:hypothetical protein
VDVVGWITLFASSLVHFFAKLYAISHAKRPPGLDIISRARWLFAAHFEVRRWVFYYLCREGSVQAEAALRLYLLLLLLLLMLCVGDIGKSDAQKMPLRLHTFVSEKCRAEFELGVVVSAGENIPSTCATHSLLFAALFCYWQHRDAFDPGRIRSIIRVLHFIRHASSTQIANMLLFICSKAPVT